jgi:hypothetical protein
MYYVLETLQQKSITAQLQKPHAQTVRSVTVQKHFWHAAESVILINKIIIISYRLSYAVFIFSSLVTAAPGKLLSSSYLVQQFVAKILRSAQSSSTDVRDAMI